MRISVKISLFLSVLGMFVGLFGYSAFAVPGAGVLLQYTQPNGESFKAAQYGDEHYNWVTAQTGEVITKDKDNYWKYAEKINGKIVASPYKYSKSGQKPIQVIKNNDIITMVQKGTVISNSPKLIDSSKSSTSTITSEQIGEGTAQALSGQPASSQKILVLLVQFSDVKMKYSDSQWSSSFFGASNSVNAYYNEVSMGQFGFSPAEEAYGATDDGVIKVTLNYPNPNTGGNIGYANQKIVADALAAASPYINYPSFDTNHNGSIQANELHVVTVCAGYEASYGGGVSPSIWAHRWVTSANVQGISFSGYTQESEVHYNHMATIGVLCHELGHDLGLPDFYDYTGNSAGIGIHSIMAGGSWGQQVYPGDSPSHFDAWCEIQLGFVTPTVVNASGDYAVNSNVTGEYNILKIPTTNPNEYFLIENRQFEGYDKSLSNMQRVSGGIAVWHADQSVLNGDMSPNDNVSHKGLDLEEANQGILGYSQLDTNKSGFYVNGSYYSGYSHYYFANNPSTIFRNTNIFGPTTVPNSSLYNNTYTGISISTNSSSSDSMLVTVSSPGMETAPVISSVSASPNPFSPDGTNTAAISYTLSKDAYVSLSIYDVNNNLIKTIENNVLKTKGSLTSTWYGNSASGKIVGDAVYTYKITAVDKYGLSANPATATITVETSNPTITNVSDSPDPYSGALNTFSTIGYTLSEKCGVSIKLYDSANNLVNTLVNSQVSAGAQSVKWNGKDSNGKPCKNGDYTYKIDAVDLFNNSADQVTGTITIDRGAPITLMLYGDKPDPFKTSTRITYGTTQPGTINLKIYDSNNNLVRSLINNSQRQAGTFYTTWTGRDNSNKPVSSGVYTYSIEAEDNGGNIAGPFTGTVTIDRIGPEITNISAADYPFTPNGSNSTTISYNLSENGKLSANLYSPTGALLRTLVNKAQQSAGNNSLTWDGKNNYEEIVPDGTYTIKVAAIDSFGNKSANVSQAVTIQTGAPSIENVSDSPDLFGLGNGKVCTISYILSKDAHVTVSIYDGSGNLVKKLTDADVKTGARNVTWDGTNTLGTLVNEGVYVYKIDAVDAFGMTSQAGGTITTDKTPVAISSVSISPSTFMPSGAILYTISKDAKVTVAIYDNQNKVVKTIENATLMTSGVHSSLWDGKTSTGVNVAAGNYTYKITAVDNAGFSAAPASGTIVVAVVDKTAPVISNVSDSPDPIKLGTGGVVSINYSLSKDALVTLRVYDKNNNLVRTLLNQNVTAVSKTVTWDGKNESGTLVTDGTYIYKINAADSAGNVGNQVVGIITTDKTPVIITNVSTNPLKFATSGTIYYTLSENAAVTITIYDGMNNQVRTLVNAQSKNGGANSVLWDGKDDNGFGVQSGNYTFTITAVDQAGFLATAQGTIAVDGPAPVISNQSSSPEPFIASGNNVVSITYTISSNASATIKIYDSNSKIVRTLQNGSAVLRGQNTVSWNGKNDAGTLQADGVYTYKIDAVDGAGKASNQAAGNITIDTKVPSITNVTVSPNPIASNSSTTIAYNISEKAYVTVSIIDGSGNVVRALDKNVLKNAGANTVIWDCKDSSGNALSGIYTFEIYAVDLAKFSALASGGITVIDNSLPVISNVSSSPKPFVVNGSNTVDISYSLSRDMIVDIKIYDSNNVIIKTLISSIQQQKGSNSVWWDGRNSSGALVSKGTYVLKISGLDGLGNAATASGSITVVSDTTDTTGGDTGGTVDTGDTGDTGGTVDTGDTNPIPPVISAVGVSPSTFNVSTTISYKISENAKITLVIKNGSAVIRILENGISKNSGVNSSVWDGKDSNRISVNDGNYTFTITAVDAAGLSASATGSVVKSAKAPVISSVSDVPDPFKPNGSSVATINYTLNKNVLLSAKIYDTNGILIRTLINSYPATAGRSSTKWDGKNDRGTIVLDGTYTYKINAVDTFGNAAVEVVGTITVDTTAPIISSFSANPYPFAPDGNSTMTISYNLSENVAVTMAILDDSNNVITTLVGEQDANAGANSVKWNGTADGAILDDDVYRVKITAVDLAGNSTEYYDFIAIDRFAPQIMDVYDEPDPFNPDVALFSTIHAGFSEYVTATASLFDSSNNEVKNIGMADISEFFWGWSGTDSYGSKVKDGVYIYKIDAADAFNKAAQEASGTVTVDSTVPVISGVSFMPELENPSGTISYNTSKTAKVTTTIFDGVNNPIRILESDVQKNAGVSSVYWDGKNSSGVQVGYGIYIFKITAVDLNGASALPAVGVITFETIDEEVMDNSTNETDVVANSNTNSTQTTSTSTNQQSQQPSGVIWNPSGILNTYPIIITNLSDGPDPIRQGGVNVISFSISQSANVTVKVYDAYGNLVKIILNQNESVGAQTVSWDGTNSYGGAAVDGIYTYKITANSVTSAEASGTITVANARPIITGVYASPGIFAPSGTVNYTTQGDVRVITTISDSSSKIIRTLESGIQRISGTYAVNWDGKDQTGGLVSSGVYTFNITFENASGLTTQASGSITVDSTSLTITAVFSPNPYNPRGQNGGFAPAAIYVNLSEAAVVTVGIYKTDGSIVKLLSSGEKKPAGNTQISWIGIDESGAMVQQGTYVYKITGVTDSGKYGEVSGTIVVD